MDPGLLESLKSGFRESDMLTICGEQPRLVGRPDPEHPNFPWFGEAGAFPASAGAKGILENLLHQAGRFGGQPLVIAGGAAKALPLITGMIARAAGPALPWPRVWRCRRVGGLRAGRAGEMARHAAEESALGSPWGRPGADAAGAEVTPASVRALPAGAAAGG